MVLGLSQGFLSFSISELILEKVIVSTRNWSENSLGPARKKGFMDERSLQIQFNFSIENRAKYNVPKGTSVLGKL